MAFSCIDCDPQNNVHASCVVVSAVQLVCLVTVQTSALFIAVSRMSWRARNEYQFIQCLRHICSFGEYRFVWTVARLQTCVTQCDEGRTATGGVVDDMCRQATRQKALQEGSLMVSTTASELSGCTGLGESLSTCRQVFIHPFTAYDPYFAGFLQVGGVLNLPKLHWMLVGCTGCVVAISLDLEGVGTGRQHSRWQPGGGILCSQMWAIELLLANKVRHDVGPANENLSRP